MKNETVPVRLEDYRPPDFTIDKVELDFRLDPKATQVTARLARQPPHSDYVRPSATPTKTSNSSASKGETRDSALTPSWPDVGLATTRAGISA